MPLVEIVRSSRTSEAACETVKVLLRSVGMVPLVLHKPIFGFVVNRLQAAVVNEAMYLVGQGVIDPDDLDACMTDGLALRWAFLGPFSTMDLNAPQGVREYMDKFGKIYQLLGQQLGVAQPWSSRAMERVERARRSDVSIEQLEARRQKRDAMIGALRRLRNRL